MNEHSEDPLHWHLFSDVFYQQVQARLEDPNKKDYGGKTLLHVAARSRENNSRILQLLLDRGANVNSITPDGHTPLHFAVCSRKRDTVVALIEAGASVNSRDFLGRTALHLAITKRWPNPPSPILNIACDMWIVERLLCDPEIILNPVDERGETPLVWAVKERHSNAARALLKKGANPNIANEDNRTALHVALSARNPSYDIVILLLTNRAGIYCEDKFRQTPIDILVRNVCDDETHAFASRCVRLIAFRYQIRESLKRKLERIPVLSNHFDECCKEVRLMRRAIIHDKFTLYDFALDCFQARVQDPVRTIYIPVVEILLSGLCRKYFELIFSRISLPELRRVLEITAGGLFSFDILLPDASNFTTFDAIDQFYDENSQLKRHLRRVIAFLMNLN